MGVRAWGLALVRPLLGGSYHQRPVSNKLLGGPSAAELVEATAMRVLAVPTQAGMAQAGTTQTGTTQAGMAQGGTTQAGMTQTGTAQAGMASAGMAQAGMAQAGGGVGPRQALDASLRQGRDAGPDPPPRMLLGSGMGQVALMSTLMVRLATNSCLRKG